MLIFSATGTIPKELGHMKALKAFYIDGNKFTSTFVVLLKVLPCLPFLST